MANIGYYIITLKKSHLEWGTHRYTSSRGDVYGEGYIPIPLKAAKLLELYNSNATDGADMYGKNLYHCTSKDGNYSGVLKAQGCKTEGDIFAKQFSGNNDLKSIGAWYKAINARIGDRVKVTITRNDAIEIEKI
jgi:hypothetical protein